MTDVNENMENNNDDNSQELDLDAQEQRIANEFLEQLHGSPEDDDPQTEVEAKPKDAETETKPEVEVKEKSQPGNLDAKAFVAARKAQRERDNISRAHTASQSELAQTKAKLERYENAQNPFELLSAREWTIKDMSDWLEADGNIDKMANMPSKEVQALQKQVAELQQDRENQLQAEQQKLEQEQDNLIQNVYNDIQVVIDEGDYPCCKALNVAAVVWDRINNHWLENQTILEYADATSAIENEIIESLRVIPKEMLLAKIYPEENPQKEEVTPGKKRVPWAKDKSDDSQTNTLSNNLSSDSGTQLNLTDADDKQLAKMEDRLHAQWRRENFR